MSELLDQRIFTYREKLLDLGVVKDSIFKKPRQVDLGKVVNFLRVTVEPRVKLRERCAFVLLSYVQPVNEAHNFAFEDVEPLFIAEKLGDALQDANARLSRDAN